MRLIITLLGRSLLDILIVEGDGPADDTDQPYLDSEGNNTLDNTPQPYGFRPSPDPVPWDKRPKET